jgi:hypothetical protein
MVGSTQTIPGDNAWLHVPLLQHVCINAWDGLCNTLWKLDNDCCLIACAYDTSTNSCITCATAAPLALAQELMEMCSEQANLFDWFGRIADYLEW